MRRVLKRMLDMGGPHMMYGTVYGTQAVLHIAEPEAAAAALSSSSKSPGYDHFQTFCGSGVFTSDGAEWRAKRASVNHALFSGGRLQDLDLLVNREADRFCREGAGRVVEVVRKLQGHTLSIIHSFLTGGEIGEFHADQKGLAPGYIAAITAIRLVILARARSIWVLTWEWVYRHFSRLSKEEQVVMKPIREFSQLAVDAAQTGVPLNVLKQRRSHSTSKDLIDESITLLFAGQDTSAATLSWALHLLSQPGQASLRQRLHQEIIQACPQGPITAKDIGNMPLLDAVVKEAQRLHPVAPFVVRMLEHDMMLQDGTVLPKGVLACVWIHCLHRHPHLWSNPEDFLPERWMGDPPPAPEGSFIPFAVGPRNCVGRAFAKVSLRVMLARLCREFNLKSREESEKQPQVGFTVLPAGGLRIECCPWKGESKVA
ncbi:unnamed protein product [Chrysoparadoxa australica]